MKMCNISFTWLGSVQSSLPNTELPTYGIRGYNLSCGQSEAFYFFPTDKMLGSNCQESRNKKSSLKLLTYTI